MNRIVVDEYMTGQLRGLAGPCPIFDGAGNQLGLFQPVIAKSIYEKLEPSVSDEELELRSREGGGRTLTEIMADLESRT